jgi:hypothetical protein
MPMPSRKDPTSKRLFDQFEQTRIVNFRKLFDSVFLKPGKHFDTVFNFEDDRIFLLVARNTFCLSESKQDDPMRDAFEAAGLDHRNPRDWKTLLSCFAEAHFGDKRTKTVKWDPIFLNEVFKDYSEVQKNNPKRSDVHFCSLLLKDKRYKDKYDMTLDSLRKLVRHAKNPKHNVLLRHSDTSDPLLELLREMFGVGGIEWDQRLEEWAKGVLAQDYFKIAAAKEEDGS